MCSGLNDVLELVCSYVTGAVVIVELIMMIMSLIEYKIHTDSKCDEQVIEDEHDLHIHVIIMIIIQQQ